MRTISNLSKTSEGLHYICNIEDDYYFFSPINYMLVKATSALYHLLAKQTHGEPISEEEKIYLESFHSQVLKKRETITSNVRTLDKLTLVVSNNCNLKCKYCYVDGGNHDKRIKDSLMSESVAVDTINYIYNRYDKVELIAFFGGEPLLNLPVIKKTVNYISELYKQGKIKSTPSYSITTNGTIFSKEMFSFFNEHNFNVCFSLDGTAETHNILRPYKNGKGTYNTIQKNIQITQKLFPNIKLAYSTTYTKIHYDQGLSINELRDFFNKEFNLKFGAIVPVMDVTQKEESYAVSDNNKLYDLLMEDKEVVWDSYIKGEPIIDTETMDFMMLFLKKGISKYICQMGITLITINSNGDIYPCQTLLNNQEMIMGNIYNSKEENDDSFAQYKNKTIRINKQENTTCKDCIAINFCQGCPSRWYYERNTFEPWSLFCKSIQEQTRITLEKIALLQRSPEIWTAFTSSVNSLNDIVKLLRSKN